MKSSRRVPLVFTFALGLTPACGPAAQPAPRAAPAAPSASPAQAGPAEPAATSSAQPESRPCTTTQVASPGEPAAPPAPTAIRWARVSAEHCALFLQTYRWATEHVQREAAKRARGTWAVVLDADETVLDTSTYQLERARLNLPYDSSSWNDWTKRREATPLPGASEFLARVRALGGKVAIVTNRAASECPDTEAVFQKHELAYDVMLCAPADGSSDKNPRFKAVAEGKTPAGLPPLEVVAFVGDNIKDFPEQSQAIRHEKNAAFAAFGARFFVLPNAMYGSWEKN